MQFELGDNNLLISCEQMLGIMEKLPDEEDYPHPRLGYMEYAHFVNNERLNQSFSEQDIDDEFILCETNQCTMVRMAHKSTVYKSKIQETISHKSLNKMNHWGWAIIKYAILINSVLKKTLPYQRWKKFIRMTNKKRMTEIVFSPEAQLDRDYFILTP